MSLNLDQNELEKFSSRADAWWDPEGEFKTLHDINPVRLGYIEACCPLASIKVLDVGCGGGLLAEAMASRGAIVSAIDASNENINCASQHARQSELNIHYQRATAEELASTHQGEFDLVTCMELLEHVPDPHSLIHACSKLVRPGGHVIFSTLNRHPKAYLMAVMGAEYVLNLLPKGTHDYKKFIQPSELVRWCRQNGLGLNDLRGLSYNPLLKRCSLISKPDINYLLDTIAE